MLKEFLEQVWAAVAKEALNMIFEGAHTEGFEEDARLQRFGCGLFPQVVLMSKAMTMEMIILKMMGRKQRQTNWFCLEFDAARKIAQGLVHIWKLWLQLLK